MLITPTGVDLDRFSPPPDGQEVRARFGLDGKVVIGWAGSFRGFHVVEQLVAAAPEGRGRCCSSSATARSEPASKRSSRTPASTLSSPEPFRRSELPIDLAAMDVGVVMADPRSFHYSPLKLAEYLAAGLPVVAPDVAPLGELLEPDGECGPLRRG